MADKAFWAYTEKTTAAVVWDEVLIQDSEDGNIVKRMAAAQFKWPIWDDGEDWSNWTDGTDGTDINWLWAYSWWTAYVINDSVSYNWSSYICILASTGNLPTNATYWDIMAAKWDAWAGSWDMAAATYDPTSVNWDAFDMDNMSEGTSNKILTNGTQTIEWEKSFSDDLIVDTTALIVDTTNNRVWVWIVPNHKLHISNTAATEKALQVSSSALGVAMAQFYSNVVHTWTWNNSLLAIHQDQATATWTCLNIRNDGTWYAAIFSAGNVWIQQTVPTELLHIGDGSSDTYLRIEKWWANSSWIKIARAWWTDASIKVTGDEDLAITYWESDLWDKFFIRRWSSWTSVAIFDATGNVWIGDNTPDAKLDVAWDIKWDTEINTQTGTTYTLALADRSAIVEMNNASANVITIPTNASVAFPIWTTLTIIQYGAWITTATWNTWVTINGISAWSKSTTAQYEWLALYKRASNEWICVNK